MALLKSFTPGKVIEVGCGAGAVLYDISRLGYHCTALETSEKARETAEYINRDSANFTSCAQADPGWKNTFDFVFSFEVLEHIEDDEQALSLWASWLKDKGYLFLSVPAHVKRWGPDDEAVGHFRRYERRCLEAKLLTAGLEVIHHECWGYPLNSLMRPLRIRKYRKVLANHQNEGLSRENRSAMSGVERSAEAKLLRILQNPAGRLVMHSFFLLQRAFSRTDLGSGLLLIARKA